MTKIIKSIMISCILCTGLSSVVYSATTSQLTSILSKYCVAPAGACGTDNEAIYTSNRCECKQCGYFYNTTSRKCEPCPLGTATDTKTDTSCKDIVCPNGHVGTIINDGKCPAGYILQQITGGSCPVGSVLTKM